MHLGAGRFPLLTIAKCQALDYYEREVINGREDYLSESGASPGRWVGSLAAADGFHGVADRDALARVFEGVHPAGFRLTASDTTVPGFDLTLSPSKSVSLVWALGTEDDAQHVEEALYAARDEVERYLERSACFVRRGHAGASVEPGTGFMGAVFRHRTSRLGDPGIHLHWTIFNVAAGPDGRRTALDGRALYRERYTAEAIFQATLRRELTTRLGLVFDEMDRHGVAEVVGVSGEMRSAFSRRRTEIVAEMERVGVHSASGARIAALTTRRPKPVGITEADLRAEWRDRAGDLRFDLSAVPRVIRTPELRITDNELGIALTEQHATFERRDAVREAAKAARHGATLDEILARSDRFLGSEQAVPVADGRWSTPEILALEQRVIGLASGPTRDELRADVATVDAALDGRASLSDEQRHMVRSLCSGGQPIDVVIGRAGAGKTFTLDAVRDAFEASGHRVLGVSLAARAARELSAGAGIRSSTAHSMQTALDTGRTRLRQGDVLVIDEAAMLGTRLLASLAEAAHQANAKVVLVGDPRQLAAIEAGGLFTALASRIRVVELTENRRQQDPAERAITAALRDGRTELAVRRLEEHGHLTISSNSDALRDQMALDWWAHRADGRDVLLGAPHRSDVRDLNARAHALLEAAGQLGPLVAEVDEQRFCVGDRVLALKNRYDLGILNGDLAEVTGADQRGVHIRCSDGRSLNVPADYVAEHLQHGYARTVHKSQGLTCDVALLVGDDTLYAELGYTGLTRGRQENHLYAVANPAALEGESQELDHVIRALDRSHAKAAAVDYLEPMTR
jgi:conjugative relaxase-like TrwC/TraI family protein